MYNNNPWWGMPPFPYMYPPPQTPSIPPKTRSELKQMMKAMKQYEEFQRFWKEKVEKKEDKDKKLRWYEKSTNWFIIFMASYPFTTLLWAIVIRNVFS